MEAMKLALRKVHRTLYFTSVFLVFASCYPALYFLSKNSKRYYTRMTRIRRWISKLSAYLAGIRFEVHYETEMDWTLPYIICPNHTSTLDIPALSCLCPEPFSFLGKEELLNNPVTRIFFKTIDIPVNRNSKISAFKAFKGAENLVKQGKTVVIFPEGGIDDRYPPSLQKFKAGAFRLAQATNTPILPVVIHNAWEILWDDGLRFGSRPGVVRISVLQPITVAPATEKEYDRAAQKVYEKMHSTWLNKDQPFSTQF